MRYKGYVVTYAGGLLKVNRENYFLNGITRDDSERADVYDVNRDFARRNLYAVSSGVKCDEDGDSLSLMVSELTKNYATSDFSKEYQTYFSMINSAINGRMLKKNGEHFEVDTSVLYIENDVARVYNYGDMPVLYYSKGKMEKVTGLPPKTVEIEKTIYENKWKIDTQVIEKTNIPYLGFPSTEYETVPYESSKIKLKRRAFFVMCSKSVLDLVGEEGIKQIFANKRLSSKKKVMQIIDRAIGENEKGNYTVQLISVKNGIPIAPSDIKNLIVWLVLALLCIPLYFSSSYIVDEVNRFMESTKTFVETYITKDAEPDSNLVWIPKETEGEEDAKTEETDEQSDVDTADKPAETAPQKTSAPKPQKSVTLPQNPISKTAETQKPAVQEQKTEVSTEPKQEVELPGTTAPPETNGDVELPIDFN